MPCLFTILKQFSVPSCHVYAILRLLTQMFYNLCKLKEMLKVYVIDLFGGVAPLQTMAI
jgi:hypothetical protein